MKRPAIFHSTSEPFRFFGRRTELALLDEAFASNDVSLVAFVGPGGQGKTAIVRHWLQQASTRLQQWDGLFFWSFYRGKDSDLCLRQLYAYAEGLEAPPDLSASFCVDRLLARLRGERWAIVLDGTEVVQHEEGSWRGRFVHPELGRLLEELASDTLKGVVVLTTRFALPTLETRRHARLLSLSTLDLESSCLLLETLGVQADRAELESAARSCGLHAKAVELLGTYLVRFAGGTAKRHRALPEAVDAAASDEERHVSRVLAGFHAALPADEKDLLALATAFRQPPREEQFLEYARSKPVHHLLHDTWRRPYYAFAARPLSELQSLLDGLVRLRLLERVSANGVNSLRELTPALPDVETSRSESNTLVLDAHPLVRRGFEGVLGGEAKATAGSRAGFLRGRPDRRPPASLEDAREEVELFHALCDAGLWNEADGAYLGFDNPKHRFLAPVFERDLLLRFFPQGDWRQRPLWEGFGRYRSLAICLEMMGEFAEALEVYRAVDWPLRGDALVALGQLTPILEQSRAPAPWEALWQAYRVHALALAGRAEEAARQAGLLFPADVYEWVHVFEGLKRIQRLDLLDMPALEGGAADHAWASLAKRRMRVDYRHATQGPLADLGEEYRRLMEAYDRGGLPWERALVRLSLARWCAARGDKAAARQTAGAALQLGKRHGMAIVTRDAEELLT